MENKKSLPITRVFAHDSQKIDDDVITEYELVLILNRKKIATLLCTPEFINELIVGHLFSAGIINSYNDLSALNIEIIDNSAHISLPGVEIDEANLIKGGDPEAFTRVVPKLDVENTISVDREQIFELMDKFKDASKLFEATGAAHSNCLCSETEFLIFSEDVARHNAIDKTIGKAMTQRISLDDKILIASCRVSKALSLKIAHARIPIIASVSAVTDAAVEICNNAGITLIGFARGKRMNVYTHPSRIK